MVGRMRDQAGLPERKFRQLGDPTVRVVCPINSGHFSVIFRIFKKRKEMRKMQVIFPRVLSAQLIGFKHQSIGGANSRTRRGAFMAQVVTSTQNWFSMVFRFSVKANSTFRFGSIPVQV